MAEWEGFPRLSDVNDMPEPRQACPNDGTPLDEADGVLHCPFDGWTARL